MKKIQDSNKKLNEKLAIWKENLKTQKTKALELKEQSEKQTTTSEETKNLIQKNIESINGLEKTVINDEKINQQSHIL